MLIIFLLVLTVSSTDVFIFWGYPLDGTSNCVNTTTSSFETCVASCSDSDTCMLASGNDDYCMLCDLFVVNTIAQSDATNGVKTAIKLDEVPDECPVSMEAQEYTGTNINNNTYTMTYSGGIWSITYTSMSCPNSTFTKFYRPLGQFCIGVFGSTRLIPRTTSMITCQSLGGLLTGIQSQAEMDFITAKSKSLTGSLTNYLYTATWVQGKRIGSCNEAGSETWPQCVGLKTFNIDDRYLSSYSMYNLAPGTPSSVKDRGTLRECLQLLMSQSKTSWQGRIQEAVCTYPCNANSSICATSYACGIPAF